MSDEKTDEQKKEEMNHFQKIAEEAQKKAMETMGAKALKTLLQKGMVQVEKMDENYAWLHVHYVNESTKQPEVRGRLIVEGAMLKKLKEARE